MEFVKFNEPLVEINADRKPRLTGGRRGAPTLLPGGTNVTNNLVPVSQLPPSAGSLDAVFKTIKRKPMKTGGVYAFGPDGTEHFIDTFNVEHTPPKKGKGKKTGGASLAEVLHHPSEHQAQFNKVLAVAKGGRRGRPKKSAGTMVMNPDGSATGVGSDDPNHWSRMPKKIGGAYLKDGKIHTSKKGLGSSLPSGLFHHTIIPSGGKMSSLVPSHGHGAQTQIGTNYKLAQFGGSMTQPIGNTASTLSPALSGMSVGAGRKSSPKGKHLKKLIDVMVKGRKHYCGCGMKHDAYNTIMKIATGLYHEFGPQIFETGKDVLLEALKEGAKHYISGGGMDGGSFWGDVLDGLKSVGSWLWDTLKEVLNSAVVKEIGKELASQGLALAKEYALGKLTSGAPTPVEAIAEYSGKGRPGANGHGIANPVLVGKFKKMGGVMPLPPGYDMRGIANPIIVSPFKQKGGVMPLPPGYDMRGIANPIIVSPFKQKGGVMNMPGGNGHGVMPLPPGYEHDMPSPVMPPLDVLKVILSPADYKKYLNSLKNGSGMPGGNGHGVRKIGGKKPSARGAIVSKIMKEKGLSLPMASKYVKEHGLY
jgi:hypothetical protein